MTFKYIAVPAGTSDCPIPCRVQITQRVEQMWATCSCRGRNAHPHTLWARADASAPGLQRSSWRPPANPPRSRDSPEQPLLGADGAGAAPSLTPPAKTVQLRRVQHQGMGATWRPARQRRRWRLPVLGGNESRRSLAREGKESVTVPPLRRLGASSP